MGLPTDTTLCCHGCEFYNDGYCRLKKENVKEQDFCNRWRGKEFTFDYGIMSEFKAEVESQESEE